MHCCVGLLVALCVALPAIAAEATFESFRDPAAKPLDPGARVLVLCKSSDFAYRMMLEKQVAADLNVTLQIDAVPAYELFPPTRDIGDEERAKKLAETGVQAILTVELAASSTRTKEVGVSQPVGGMTIHSSRTKYRGLDQEFQIELIGVTQSLKLWMAKGHSSCGRSGDENSVAATLSRGIAARIGEVGLAPLREQAKPH